jgi:hypothetical protein
MTARRVKNDAGLIRIFANADLPESVTGHRIDYWTWVEKHADTAIRDKLLVLRDHWRDNNAGFFDGRMLEPYITLTEPSAPQLYGQCCSLSSWGSRLEIKLRPSLLDGTHPQLGVVIVWDGPLGRDGLGRYDKEATEAGRLQFVKDVLLHEMIHQHIMEHQPDVNEESYHGHGPVFTEHCNRIGAQLGLDEVVVRNRNGKKLPKSPQWPMCVAGPDRYLGVFQPHQKRVTATSVTIPPGYRVFAVEPASGMDDYLEIGFAPASGDGPCVYVDIEADAAAELAESIMDHLDSHQTPTTPVVKAIN